MHTFTENDIFLAEEFIDQCIDKKVRFKVALSHSLLSWDQLSHKNIYNIVFNLTQVQLHVMIKYFPKFYPTMVSKYIKSFLSILHGAPRKNRSCLDAGEKLVFYRGKFVGSCMLFANHNKSYSGD